MNQNMNILVVRNDKLGDFMLSYPSFAILKQSVPQAHIFALVPHYTQEMANACPWIDNVVLDPGENASFKQNLNLLKIIREKKFDAVITLFSTTRIGFLLYLARIPFRLAPATKIAQLFYNQRLRQRRSRSEKPEYAYNADLVKYFLTAKKIPVAADPLPPLLQFNVENIQHIKNEFCKTNNINHSDRLIFLHPGSGGSANNLSIRQYAQLVRLLKSSHGFTVIITAGPSEIEAASHLSSLIPDTQHVVYRSTNGLRHFAEHIQFADVFISGSTGPLHIAGALNVPTAGFYTRRQSATSLRWQTLNSPDCRLAISPPLIADQQDMSKVDINLAATEISQKFLA